MNSFYRASLPQCTTEMTINIFTTTESPCIIMAQYAMSRRQLLIGVAGASGLSVAGCSGNGADEGPQDDAPEDNENSSEGDLATSPTATDIPDSIERAADLLSDAADRFRSETENLDQSEFQTSEIHTLLDRTGEELDAARSEATPEQRAAIETVRSIVEWLRNGVQALEFYGEAVANLERGGTYYDNERFEEAAEQAETALTGLERSTASLDEADAVYERLDLATLEAIGEDPDEIRSELETLNTRMDDLALYVETMETFARAQRHHVAGTDHYVKATGAVDEDRFSTASELFAEARTEFESANSLSRDGEEKAPQELLEEFLVLTCKTENLREAADHMHTAAMEAEAGNSGEADEAYEAALSAEEAVDEC